MAKRSPSQSRRSAAAAAAAEEEGAGEASRRWCLSPPLGLCFFLREGGREVEVEVEVEFFFFFSVVVAGHRSFFFSFSLSALVLTDSPPQLQQPQQRKTCATRTGPR